jgi:hypothetical protein
MRHVKILLVVVLFVLSIPLLAAGENEKERAPVTTRTKKEFMQTWLNVSEAVGGVPVISPFSDWDYYYLQKSISWKPEVEYQKDYKAIEVPPGFVTDLASIPKVFWSILPPAERYSYAAIIHDYLYWTQMVPRDVADQILKICMEEMNVENVKVVAIYNAVKMFGDTAWEENANLKRKGEKRLLKKFPEDPRVTWEEWKKQKDVFTD